MIATDIEIIYENAAGITAHAKIMIQSHVRTVKRNHTKAGLEGQLHSLSKSDTGKPSKGKWKIRRYHIDPHSSDIASFVSPAGRQISLWWGDTQTSYGCAEMNTKFSATGTISMCHR